MDQRSPLVFADERLGRARRGIGFVFFQQGLLVGGWSVEIPVQIERLGITEGAMGGVIFAFGIGSILAMLGMGPVIDRVGSLRVTRIGLLLSALVLPTLVVMPSLWAIAGAALLCGAVIGTTDVAMNAHSLAVERAFGRPIVSSIHAHWSLGALTGAFVIGPVIGWTNGLGGALAVAAGTLVLAAYALPRLLADAPETRSEGVVFRLPSNPLVLMLGLIALLSFVQEGAIIDWSAVYARETLGTGVAWSGVGVAAFSLTMTTMRFAGDAVRRRVGAVATVRLGAVVAAFGFAIAGAAGFAVEAGLATTTATVLAMLGFAMAGLGSANIVPIAFVASGDVPGVPTAISLSFVTMTGYSGILLAPAVLGWIGEHLGFAPVYAGLALLPLLIVALAGAVRPAAS